MAKTYINNAVVGNSSMLGCISEKGELVRFFWPNIDYPQHVEKLAAGIFWIQQKHSTLWFDEGNWQYRQYYQENTNILTTECIHYERGIKVTQTDFCLPQKNILVRRYEIENIGADQSELGFVSYSNLISTHPEFQSSLFDYPSDALIHYRHNYYIAIAADRVAYQFQLGDNAYESAKYTELKGYNSIGMMPDGAVSWHLGSFAPGEMKSFTLGLCAGNSFREAKSQVREFRALSSGQALEDTRRYWLEFLKSARAVHSGNQERDALYKRSLLLFKLMADKKTGGLLAAPEIDEDFTRCGRYAYCWGRDAAFITGALDRSGLTSEVDKFYQWAIDTQDEDGSWQQRHHMDGNLAPCWGLQVDETGTLIWGMLEHYKVTRDMDFLRIVWPSVHKGVEFLLRFRDEETGLPAPSYDLWEERMGEHAYSTAAVYGGIHSGAEIGRLLQMDVGMLERWDADAAALKGAMLKYLWKEDLGRFIRSIRTKLNPWGGEHSAHTALVKINPKGVVRDFTLEDGTADISLLGISVPFGVLEASDPKMEETARIVEQALTCPGIGGIGRYENDNYIGGNPWILTTLWSALYHIQRKNYNTAREYLNWAVQGRTTLDLLPEQINKSTGKPEWVIPLTWSHAMYVLVYIELYEAGEL